MLTPLARSSAPLDLPIHISLSSSSLIFPLFLSSSKVYSFKVKDSWAERVLFVYKAIERKTNIMDMYGLPTPELFHIDDLLDLSNEELFSSASIATVTATTTNPSDQTTFTYASASSSSSPSVATTFPPSFSTDFPHDLCLPVSNNNNIYITFTPLL